MMVGVKSLFELLVVHDLKCCGGFCGRGAFFSSFSTRRYWDVEKLGVVEEFR
jgi:hypothetical protein